jgi:hypothetical protein
MNSYNIICSNYYLPYINLFRASHKNIKNVITFVSDKCKRRCVTQTLQNPHHRHVTAPSKQYTPQED